ncbi:MAG: VOC family protein [Myxococcaceae bacterium]|nr:VOC family protein [Myxococcaceae bacterium]MCI0672223.1 VOC family protein [Myxococcaceae bacterium]
MAAKKAKRATRAAQKKTKRVAPKKVKPIPEGYPPLSPVTIVDRCGEAIDFYKSVFGAKERMRMPMPGGKIAHAELNFGPAVLMLSDEQEGFPTAKARLSLYVKDCDAVYQKAVAAGAKSKEAPTDQFWGDRSCRVVDPFGNEWTLMTHKEDVSKKEMQRRMASMGQPGGQAA